MDEEKRYVVRFFWRQNANKREILDSMKKSYGDACPSESFIRKWLSRFDSGELSVEDKPRPGRPICRENVLAVSKIIEEQPFASARTIAMTLNIDKNTVINILRNDLHLEKRYAKWIPHILSDDQKAKRVQVSIELREILQSLSANQLTATITCDEAWFYLAYYNDAAWVEDGKTFTKPKRLISDQKIMIFTAFSTAGIVLIKEIPPGTRFNSTTMCQTILPLLKDSISNHDGIRNDLRCRIHLDNARPHVSKITQSKMAQLQFIQLPQPPYSPDVSPNDFFLYGMLKEQLKGRSHETYDDLMKSLHQILAKIPKNTWRAVYEEWISRLDQVIASGGEYL